jgi:hypothetical protein
MLESVELHGLDRLAARRLGPGRAARLGARLLAAGLDVRLAAGADPGGSALLAARAAALASRPSRGHLAQGLERVVDAVHRPRRRWWSVVGEDPIPANAAALAGLSSLLQSDRPLYARGVAALSVLVSDGTGPLYRGDPGTLARALRDVSEAMTGRHSSP